MFRIHNYALAAVLLVYLTSFYSCLNSISGEGETALATRNIEKFTSLELDLDADVIITDSLDQSCMISAQENLMTSIETRLNREKLIIKSEKNIQNHKPITIYLSANRLSKIELNGSGTITCTNTIKTDKLNIDLNGSGAIKLNVLCDHLQAGISGSGDLELTGSANSSKFDVSGSGAINAFELNTGNCKADISGSGKAFVFPSGELNADVSGSGNVRYKGNPTKISSSVSGSGTVEKSE